MNKDVMNKRLNGSSLVEVITSMVIILVILGIATSIFVKMAQAQPKSRLHLQQELAVLAQSSIRDQDLTTKEWLLPDSIRIERRVSLYQNDSLLWLLELRAYQRSAVRPLAVYRKVILKPVPDDAP